MLVFSETSQESPKGKIGVWVTEAGRSINWQTNALREGQGVGEIVL